MVRDAKLVAFGATTDGVRAVAFYTNVLGLKLRYGDEFAISLDSNGVELRLQKVERFTPQTFTALGWQVTSLPDVLERLSPCGVIAEQPGRSN